ncbi:MAG: redoxin domain-containing protein [Flavobacteriales bacterium]|nr:redoxin domain-containing protein [Flavobacteriales bacterium]
MLSNFRSALLLGLLAISHLLPAQTRPEPEAPKRTIKVRIEGCAKDTIYLANYYGNKLFYSDTAVADAKGVVVFNKPRGYHSGVYAVVVPGPAYFEMVVNEAQIELATDKKDLLGRLEFIKSEENKLFIEYIRFLNARKVEGDALRSQSAADPITKATSKARLEELDKAVKEYQKNLIASDPGTLAAALVKMSMAVELPEPRKADGTLDSAAAYYQYRAHFWDNFDLNKDWNVRVPVFANKFEEYFLRVVPQIPDSITTQADAFIARLGTDELFKYSVHTLTHKYETSEIMGMDAVFAHMALTYYCPRNGQPGRAWWMEDDKLSKLCERARKIWPLTLGRKAPNIILTDTTEQQWIGLYDMPQEYVVIVFWDPHCGVCKKELPEIYKAYTSTLKDLGVGVFCVAKAVDESLLRDWKKFIRENGLDWVNVGLGKNVYEAAKQDARQFVPRLTTLESLNYAETYDVYSTPKLFVVDGERRFVGKQLNAEQIGDLVKQLKARKAK